VFLAHRTLPAPTMAAAMTAGRQHRDPGRAEDRDRGPAAASAGKPSAGRPPVVAIGALARYDRPAPALGAYDQLMTGNSA
jgi:hypothetical protein